MLKHLHVTLGRLANTLSRIEPLIYQRRAPLDVAAWHVGGEPVSYNEAVSRNYEPFMVGQTWGRAWDTTWFRLQASVPEEWAAEEVVALVRLGYVGGEGFTAEGLVWQNGVPSRAINVNRADIPLTRKAHGGEEFQWHIEAAANPNYQQGGYRNTSTYLAGEPQFTLQQAELACINREAFSFYHDFKVAYETLLALPNNVARPSGWMPPAGAGAMELTSDPRRGQLIYTLNAAANLFDETNLSSIAPARKLLAEVLLKHNGDTAHHLSAIGHAHIDTAWLWPLRETMRKCARTFSTALAYMEEYPDYIFGCSQPQQYAWMKEYYPSIFEGIKKAIKRGQWEPIGSMWIEADCNLASGESLVRQILHGKNFFLDEFGYETRDVWIPDVFGYSASMPQIMQQAGVNSFITQKISWSQFNSFPHHTFLWEGIDGTRIFTHFPPADTYNADFDPKQLLYNVHNFKENDRATRSLYVYGHGDGGGGPTVEMLETAARVTDLEGLPKVSLEKVSIFLEKAKEDAKDLPLWVGELYLELHRGTYTSQARNKRNNRKCEFLLRDAEFFDAMAALFAATDEGAAATNVPAHAVYDVIGRDGATNKAALLERAWKLLLLNQFHDIIPGSSINWVYRDSDRDYETIRALGEAVRDRSRDALTAQIDTSAFAEPIIIFNSLSHKRDEIVSLPDGSARRVVVPPCGYVVVEGAQPSTTEGTPVKVESSRGGINLDNGILRVRIDAQGLLASVFDQRTSREVMAANARGNVFELHRDVPNAWDAWDVDIHYKETVEQLLSSEVVEVVEDGPLRAKVQITRSFGGSRIEQVITLTAGSPRLDFDTRVDWQEQHRLLKVAFPVSVHSPRATYEIQYGHTERPTHYNTSWDLARFEVCAQKWADLSEAGYGVALLNDCKYGYDILGNVMRLSLLRGPTAPDPLADRGQHEFTYSLLPHPGSFREGGVIEEAYSLNIPLQILPAARHAGRLLSSHSFFSADRKGVVIEAIKKAEKEEAVIVRFYEAFGSRGPMTLALPENTQEVLRADLMERSLDEVQQKNGKVMFEVSPFEIVTFKIPFPKNS